MQGAVFLVFPQGTLYGVMLHPLKMFLPGYLTKCHTYGQGFYFQFCDVAEAAIIPKMI